MNVLTMNLEEDPHRDTVQNASEERSNVTTGVHPSDEIILNQRVPFRLVRRRDRLYGLLILAVLLVIALSISLPLANNSQKGTSFTPQNDVQEQDWRMIGEPISNSVVPEEEVLTISLALSDNGSIVAIGNRHSSFVRVYAWQGQNWTQMGADLQGREDSFGTDIALSGDGRTVAIGGPVQSAVRVYRYMETNQSWMLVGRAISGDAASGEQAGSSVSLSLDGNVIAIGAHLNSDEFQRSGQVRVYQLRPDGLSWLQMGSDISGEAFGDQFGNSISLSNDGLVLAVGARFHDNKESNITNSGHVRVFQFDGDQWTVAGDDIEGNEANEEFGYSVSLSGDGTTCAIGNTHGELTVYRSNVQFQQWLSVGNTIETLGKSFAFVSLSRNGNVLAVLDRSMEDGHLHVVTIFRYDDDSRMWMQIGSQLKGAGLALSGDGSIVAIGASNIDGLEYVRILTAT